MPFTPPFPLKVKKGIGSGWVLCSYKYAKSDDVNDAL